MAKSDIGTIAQFCQIHLVMFYKYEFNIEILQINVTFSIFCNDLFSRNSITNVLVCIFLSLNVKKRERVKWKLL